jgi:hypothetical protein
MRSIGLLISARWVLTLDVLRDWVRCLVRCVVRRFTEVAAVVLVVWPISLSFCVRIVMAMFVGGWCGELTFRRCRRLIKMRKNENNISLPMIRPVAWLRLVAPIVGCRSARVRVIGLCLLSLTCF